MGEIDRHAFEKLIVEAEGKRAPRKLILR